MKKCILVCAGDFAPVDFHKEEGDCIIAVDNGLTYLTEMGVLPDYCLGDFDSLLPLGRQTLEEIQKEDPSRVVTLPVAKDDTDTMAAVRFGLKLGYLRFDLYGTLGGARIAHTIANLQVLNFIRNNGAQGYLMDLNQMIFLIRNETKEFHKGFAGRFSMFAVDPEIRGVTIRGMKYEVSDCTMTNDFPIGCSNEIEPERQAAVTVAEGTALVVVGWD